jgi:hypothetical protein
MRSFIIACIAVIVLAVGGGIILNLFQVPAAVAFSTESVRLPAGLSSPNFSDRLSNG